MELKVTREMYMALFNGITDALTALDENDASSARELLIYAQRKAEEIYLDCEPENDGNSDSGDSTDKAIRKPAH